MKEKYQYLIQFVDGTTIYLAELWSTLQDTIMWQSETNRRNENEGFTFIKLNDGTWINYTQILIFKETD